MIEDRHQPSLSLLDRDPQVSMNELYLQLETIKSLSMRKLAENPHLDEKDRMRLNNTIVRVSTLQLQLIRDRHKAGPRAAAIEAIWGAMLRVPEISALLRREPIRLALLREFQRIEEEAQEEES
jgi:hypothetical protein